MTDLHFISSANEKVALARPPHIVTQSGNGSVNYVADWVMDVVNDVIGHVDEDIVVKTTIDASLQASAGQALDDELSAKGQKARVSQGALVAMTPNGAVRALIGGRNYAESQFNRAVVARRQPGSAFKPFVYLTALESGLTPDTVRDDAPINVRGWKPENYEHDYLGPVTLARALALSLNTVSVRLTLELTPQAVVRTAHRLGIASKLEPNASIALGTSEVSPLELVGAYAPFANGGYAVIPHVVERVTTARGKPLYVRPQGQLARVVEPRDVAMMNGMLEQTLTVGTAKHASLPGWPAAGKTGTSQDFRDAWFIGYTAHLVTGVWLGNDDGTPTKRVTGGSLPVELWSRFMREAHQGVPVASLPSAPDGGLLSGLFGRAAPIPVSDNAPLPPAAIGTSGSATASTREGVDGWLIGHLFGRR
jgi:penicillin-binding protein 1A